MAGLDLGRTGFGKRLQRGGRRRARGVDLDFGSAQRRRSAATACCNVFRFGVGATVPLRLVVEHRREGRHAGELDPVEAVDEVGEGNDLFDGDAAFVATVEAVTGGDDADEHRLGPPELAARGRRLTGLDLAEHGPVAGIQRRRRPSSVARQLYEVTDVPDGEPACRRGDGALQIDADRLGDPAGGDRPAHVRVAAELLGHREHGEAEPARLVVDARGVALHGVGIDDEAVGREIARLVQPWRLLPAGPGCAASTGRETSLRLLFFPRSEREMATSRITPRTIICWETLRPESTSPLLIMLIRRLPISAPTTVPLPPNRLVPPMMTAAITLIRSVSPSV